MMWPGCYFNYSGQTTTFLHELDTSMPAKMRIDTALEWFVDKKTPTNLVMLYIDELDGFGHIYGTDNDIVR